MEKFTFNPPGAEVSTFRRWGRQGYSLFRALGHQVRIGVLTSVYLYVAMPGEVHAQTDSTEVGLRVDLEEIEVSTSRVPVTYSQVARMVSVIGQNQIETAPAATIQELLDNVPGVDIRQRGTHGVQADISVRGGSFDQTLILLNGINLTDPQTGHHNFNLPVSLKSIKRIEVLHGPAARVYGPNAFSGAVNLVTEPEKGAVFELDAGGGQHALRDATALLSLGTDRLKHFVSVNHTASHGYRENTDFDTYSLFYQAIWDTNAGKLDLQLGHGQKAFGANSFYTPEYPAQFEKTRTSFASLRMHTEGAIHFVPSLYWRRHHDRFELFRGEAPDWYGGHNYHLTDVFGTGLNSWFSHSLGKTALGAEFRSETIWSNTLGEEMDQSVDVPGESGQFFTRSHSRTSLSWFAEHTFYLERFTASAGFMVNRISDQNADWHFYPGVDLSYLLSDRLRLSGSLNRSMRMPTFTDLYYDGPTNQGNAGLKPEQSVSLEGGLRYADPFLKSRICVYRRWGKNLIDWVRTSEEAVWETQNLTRINALGLEFTAELDLWSLTGKKILLRRLSVNYARTELEKTESAFFSYYALDQLKHKLVIRAEQPLFKNMSASLVCRFQDRHGSYERYEDNAYTGQASYPSFWLTDIKLIYHTGGFRFWLSGSNLFDQNYVDLGNIEQPGRWISAGINWKFLFRK
ncbi:MAG: TonB-dependent receptor plug domain-containing protein [Mangrovibacterium sp.]